jgi:hypothetical protein
VNVDAQQNTGKTQWRWDDRGIFHYSEHLTDKGERGANGPVMLYNLSQPDKLIVHIDHTAHTTDEKIKEFIKRGFKIIEAEIEVISRDVLAVRFEHEYTDFIYTIKVIDKAGV